MSLPGVATVPVSSSGLLSVFASRVGSVPGEALEADALVICAGRGGLVLSGASWLVGESSEVTGISLVAARSGGHWGSFNMQNGTLDTDNPCATERSSHSKHSERRHPGLTQTSTI